MDISKLVPLYESVRQRVLVEYTEQTINTAIAKLRPSAGRVEDNVLRAYIVRFGELVTPENTKREIITIIKRAIDNGKNVKNNNDRFEGGAIIPQIGLSAVEVNKLRNSDSETLTGQKKMQYERLKSEDKRLNALYNNPLDILKYNWKELEFIIDFFPASEKSSALAGTTGRPQFETGAEMIYNQNNLEIFFGADGKECYLLKTYVVNKHPVRPRSGEPAYAGIQDPEMKRRIYGWCISGGDNGNLHWNYRLGQQGGGMVAKSSYFVNDLDKSADDPWCFFVVHVADTESEPGKRYYVTGAYNNEDKWMSWDDLLKICPKLNGLKHLFKFKPFTKEEQQKIATGQYVSPNEFKYLTNYETKRTYVVDENKKLYIRDYGTLDKTLQNLYVVARAPHQGDPNPNAMNSKLLYMFVDSDKSAINQRYNKVLAIQIELNEQGAPDTVEVNKAWTDILYDDPVMKPVSQGGLTKEKATYYQWCKQFDLCAELMQRKAEEEERKKREEEEKAKAKRKGRNRA